MNHIKTQKRAILKLLQSRKGKWVGLPEIMDLTVNGCRIAKYTNRISDLRQDGYEIDNWVTTMNGVKRSWYRLAGNAGPSAEENHEADMFASENCGA